MCFEGRLSTFSPKSFMSRSGIAVIRPMVFIDERDISAFAKNLPVVHNPCPADKHTQREYMKSLLKKLQSDIPFAKDRITSAVMHPERYNLWDKIEQK